MDSDFIIAVRLTRLNTGSTLLVRFDIQPLHFTRLHYHLRRHYDGWTIVHVYSMGEHSLIEE